MAAIAPIVLIKISAFTVGASSYPDIRSFTAQRNPPATYKYRPEATLAPTKITQVASDQAPVTGTVNGETTTLDDLAGTSAASATITGVNAVTGSAATVTITNPSFMGSSFGGGETSPGNSSLSFEATDIAVA